MKENGIVSAMGTEISEQLLVALTLIFFVTEK